MSKDSVVHLNHGVLLGSLKNRHNEIFRQMDGTRKKNHHIIFYFDIFFCCLEVSSFLMRDRKGVDVEGREGGEGLGGV